MVKAAMQAPYRRAWQGREWFASGVELPSLDYRQLEQWIVRVADSYNRIVRTVNYIFCDDEEILKVNRRFLNHDYYTESFPDGSFVVYDSWLIRLSTERS
jgi:hypothetical protein